MGTLKKSSYTIPMPDNATVTGNMVQWIAKGEAKIGKVFGSGKVLCQSEIWIAQYVDENGNVKRISTKTKLLQIEFLLNSKTKSTQSEPVRFRGMILTFTMQSRSRSKSTLMIFLFTKKQKE